MVAIALLVKGKFCLGSHRHPHIFCDSFLRFVFLSEAKMRMNNKKDESAFQVQELRTGADSLNVSTL